MKELKNNLNDKKVVLGLSGGVDSTTAAFLLKEKGFEVTAFYFDVLGGNDKGRRDAESAAEDLGIELIYKDVSEKFNEIVINNFCNEYCSGRTPNPCVICNPEIKFKELLSTADEIGAKYIATGHYAQVYENSMEQKYFIRMGENKKKDQSYMLYRLGQPILSRLILPLGQIDDKEETRNIARKGNLRNSEKKDSQEICFISDSEGGYVNYIKNRGYSVSKGNFIDSTGNVLGEHNGLINYTVGQRKGLGITFGKPVFVTSINPENNTVTLGDGDELFRREVNTYDNYFAATSSGIIPQEYEGKKIFAKIRYAAKPAQAKIYSKGKNISIIFDTPQRAATPGQSAAFYLNETLIGGGFIK